MCPQCQRETPPDAHFCPHCGTRLARAAFPGGKISVHPLSLASSAPSVAHRTGVGRDGEPKQVTILFADLKSSMELLAWRPSGRSSSACAKAGTACWPSSARPAWASRASCASSHARRRPRESACWRADRWPTERPYGQQQHVFVHLGEARRLAEALHDAPRLGRILAFLSNYYWNVGESDLALESGREALAMAQRTGDPHLQIVANFSMGGAHRAHGVSPDCGLHGAGHRPAGARAHL
jgi:RNA polymerase subunit RPABC4/transcription elongation factor Spt4